MREFVLLLIQVKHRLACCAWRSTSAQAPPLPADLDILSKVNNVVTLTSVNNLQASLATAQRRVEQGQNQVQRDSEQLAQSRQLLAREQETLSQTQRSSQQAQADAPAAIKAPWLDQAIKVAVPQQAAPAASKSAPQLNGYGQTLGRLIDVTA